MSVRFFDTTLRDGEQSPGVTFLPQEKVDIALALQELGVDVIEAGFPATSPGDMEAVKAISEAIETPAVCALARAVESDILAAWEAVSRARRPRVHIFISTSDIHIKHQLRATREEVLLDARKAVALGRSLGAEIEFSPMDATRSDRSFVLEICAAAVDEGASVINIPDTVGYATPGEYGELIRAVVAALPGDVTVSVHTHNDLGLAAANALAGIEAGAQQVECSVNGIGERAGNASLEEMIMLLETRFPDIDTGCTPSGIYKLSEMVSRYSGYPIPPNKAIVGRNAFAHESGIHQDGVLKEPSTYEIMDPRTIGRESNELVLGKHSGRHAFADALRDMGEELSDEELQEVFRQFKALADSKQAISEGDLRSLVREGKLLEADSFRITQYRVETSSSRGPFAEVMLRYPDGEEFWGESTGDGPVDALYRALVHAVGSHVRVLDYRVEAIEGGSDALGTVFVLLERWGKRASASATGPDIVAASGQAFTRALSRVG